MKVLLVEPYKYPVVTDIDNSLSAEQEAVGGYIEAIYLDNEIVLICNEEGKVNALPLNRAVYNDKGEIVDITAGTFFICAARPDDDNFSSLTEKEIKKYSEIFHFPQLFASTSQGIKALPDLAYLWRS